MHCKMQRRTMFLFQPPPYWVGTMQNMIFNRACFPRGRSPALVKKGPLMKIIVTNAITSRNPRRNLIRSIYKKSILVSVLFATSWLFFGNWSKLWPCYRYRSSNTLITSSNLSPASCNRTIMWYKICYTIIINTSIMNNS